MKNLTFDTKKESSFEFKALFKGSHLNKNH